jgi:hypothetical protein
MAIFVQKGKLSLDIKKLEEAHSVLLEKVKAKTFLVNEKEEQLSIVSTALTTTQRVRYMNSISKYSNILIVLESV